MLFPILFVFALGIATGSVVNETVPEVEAATQKVLKIEGQE